MKNFSILILIVILCCTACTDKEEVTSFEGVMKTLELTDADITAKSAIVGGFVWITQGNIKLKVGFCYADTSKNAKIGILPPIALNEMGEFRDTLQDLSSYTEYWVKAYAIVKGDTLYGEKKKFTTSEEAEEDKIDGDKVNK